LKEQSIGWGIFTRLLVMVGGNLIMGSYGSIGFRGSYANIFRNFVRIWGFCFSKELLLGF
jgi:hypothetical protein